MRYRKGNCSVIPEVEVRLGVDVCDRSVYVGEGGGVLQGNEQVIGELGAKNRITDDMRFARE